MVNACHSLQKGHADNTKGQARHCILAERCIVSFDRELLESYKHSKTTTSSSTDITTGTLSLSVSREASFNSRTQAERASTSTGTGTGTGTGSAVESVVAYRKSESSAQSVPTHGLV